jgi:hypothetical protein
MARWFTEYATPLVTLFSPWLTFISAAMYDFAFAQDQWYSTWPVDPKERGMAM